LAQPRPRALAPRCFWQLFSALFSALFAKFVFAAAVEDTFSLHLHALFFVSKNAAYSMRTAYDKK
jgi:hypothetical protein